MPIITSIRLFSPIIVALLLLVLSSVPTYIAGASAFFPVVDIMVIYYWSSYRPGTMPDWFVFLLGVFRDSIEGLSIGISPCVYLLVRFMVVASRGLYRRENFIVVWQGLAITALIAIAGKWLLVSFIMDTPLILDYAIMQFMFSVAMYPVFHWFFSLVYITMPENFQDA